MSKETKTPQNNSEEVDLIVLINYIGNSFSRIFRFIGTIFNKLFLAFVWCVFFIKKHIIKFGISLLVGVGYGYYKDAFSDPIYKTSLIIRQNYSTGEHLSNTINYYNSLVDKENMMNLAAKLSIDSTTVSTILGFEMQAVVSENAKLSTYDDYIKSLDSVIASKIDYEDYLENVNTYEYPDQKLTIISSDKVNFKKAFSKLVSNISEVNYFNRLREKDLNQLTNREEALKSALVISDSLKNIYKRVLEKDTDRPIGSQTSITFDAIDKKNETKEFELYKNDIEIQRELVIISRQKDNIENIIEIISDIQETGILDNSLEVLGKKISRKVFYGLIFPFVVFIILLTVEFLRYLEKYKQELK